MRIILDTNVWFKYTAHGRIDTLIDLIFTNELSVYCSGQILAELFRALSRPDVLKLGSVDPAEIIDLVRMATVQVTTHNRFIISPDPKDNFLFDMAVQANCTLLITEEKRLLQFKDAPVNIRDLLWFKKHFSK